MKFKIILIAASLFLISFDLSADSANKDISVYTGKFDTTDAVGDDETQLFENETLAWVYILCLLTVRQSSE